MAWSSHRIIYFFAFHANAQGCVAIRSNGVHVQALVHTMTAQAGRSIPFTVISNLSAIIGDCRADRKSWTGIRCTQLFNFPVNVVKHITTMVNTLTLPFRVSKRTSFVWTRWQTRHATSATGLGDVRLSVYAMLFKPNRWGNLQAGLGIQTSNRWL